MAVQDLWGNLQLEAVRTPLVILREQAAALGPKTKNLVEAQVTTSTLTGKFRHRLELVVPTFDDYQYDLLTLTHDIELYPVRLDYPADIALTRVVSSEDELNGALQKALSSTHTQQIISRLAGHASAMASFIHDVTLGQPPPNAD